jgi:hypothetical protein
MNFIEKRKAKQLGKSYFIAAYAMVVVFLLMIVGLILGVATNRFPQDNSSGAVAMAIFIMPLVGGITLGAIGQYHLNKRIQYKYAIKEFRENRQFVKVLDSLRENNYNAAVDAYNMINPGTDKRKFLYGYFIGMALHSDDPKRLEQAKDKFDVLRGQYDPANVVFN